MRNKTKKTTIARSPAVAATTRAADSSGDDVQLSDSESSSMTEPVQRDSRTSTTTTSNLSCLENHEISVGKNGGVFQLSFGGVLSLPADAVTKRTTIICGHVTSYERHRYEPTLRVDEKLIGELFVLELAKGRSLKRAVCVQLPHYSVNKDFYNVGVLWRPSTSAFWQSTESSPGSGDVVNFNAAGDGVFAIIKYPRSERFDLPALGCLYSLRLHRQVSVRCAKGSVAADLQCDCQIIPLRPESLQSVVAQTDVIAATDYFRFTPTADVVFKRPLTVKLPLPVTPDIDHVTSDDVAVCHTLTSQDGGEWALIETPLKLSKNSVTFDTKILTKFCVVLVKPPGGARAMLPRGTRLADTLARIELDNDAPRGDVLPFVQFTDSKHWTMCVDCVRLEKVPKIVDTRADMTLIKPSSLQSTSVLNGESSHLGGRLNRVGWKRDRTTTVPPPSDSQPDIRLTTGATFHIEISGDVELVADNPQDNVSTDRQLRVTYHDSIPQCSRQFRIAPKPSVVDRQMAPQVLTCILRVYKSNSTSSDDCNNNQLVRCFDFDIPPDVIADFYYVPPPPQPQVVEPTTNGRSRLEELLEQSERAEMETKTATAVTSTPVKRDPRDIAETINRLTKPSRAPTIVPKEPRVLSGRSLQCLSRHIPTSGITLAVHLDISESTITGMAFDALANGLPSADITYRILLLWKRRVSYYQRFGVGATGTRDSQAAGNQQVDMLVSAVTATGFDQIADVIADCHAVNRELTPDCFATPDNTDDDVSDEQMTSHPPPPTANGHHVEVSA